MRRLLQLSLSLLVFTTACQSAESDDGWVSVGSDGKSDLDTFSIDAMYPLAYGATNTFIERDWRTGHSLDEESACTDRGGTMLDCITKFQQCDAPLEADTCAADGIGLCCSGSGTLSHPMLFANDQLGYVFSGASGDHISLTATTTGEAETRSLYRWKCDSAHSFCSISACPIAGDPSSTAWCGGDLPSLDDVTLPADGQYLMLLHTTTRYPFDRDVLHAVTLTCRSGSCMPQ
jgi:hypothetical protein